MEKNDARVPASGYVDDRFLAANTPISRVWFQHARLRGEGPPSYKFGKRVLYKWTEVIAWLDTHAAANRTGGAS